MKKQNGITLIALVITIIVLLILAGVAINAVVGDNGVIGKTQMSSEAHQKAELIERIQMEIAAKEVQKMAELDKITQSDIEEILKIYGIVNINEEDGTIKSFTPTGKNYEILIEEVYDGTLKNVVDVSTLEKGIFIEYDVEYADVYNSDYKYTTTNGWRLLDYKTKGDGKTLYDVELISTGVPAYMYRYYKWR